MKYVILVFLCLLGLNSTLMAAEKQKAAGKKKLLGQKCPLYNCCFSQNDKKSYENERLWKLAQTCWLKLAKYNVREQSAKANGQCLDRAYREARKTGRIVLYVANTGG